MACLLVVDRALKETKQSTCPIIECVFFCFLVFSLLHSLRAHHLCPASPFSWLCALDLFGPPRTRPASLIGTLMAAGALSCFQCRKGRPLETSNIRKRRPSPRRLHLSQCPLHLLISLFMLNPPIKSQIRRQPSSGRIHTTADSCSCVLLRTLPFACPTPSPTAGTRSDHHPPAGHRAEAAQPWPSKTSAMTPAGGSCA